MRQKLNLITLGVRDFEKAVAFYEQGLGWKKSSASQGDLALFSLGQMVLALYPRNLLAQDACVEEAPTVFSGMTLSYNARDKEEVDAVLAEVEKLGASIVKPAQEVFWGGYSGYFKDPDGHLIEVAYNPFWKLDGQGNLDVPV